MDGAAERVLVAGAQPSTPDTVNVSVAAKRAASGSGGDSSLTSGLESAMVDLRVSKYLAVANMKVLQTGDDVSKDLESIVRPSGG